MKDEVSKINFYEFIEFIKSKKFFDYDFEKLVIPSYQRKYVWDDDQVKDFLYSLLVDDEESFFGFMVFSYDEENNILNVVDGQQRIVTFYLFSLALFVNYYKVERKSVSNLVEFLKSIKLESYAKRDTCFFDNISTLFDKLSKISKKHEEEKLCDSLIYILYKNDNKANKTKIAENLYTIFEYIDKNQDIKKAIENYSNYLEILKNKKFVVYFCSDDEAYRIFMSLNEKGKKLKPIDLIKSYLVKNSDEEDVIKTFEEWEEKIKNNKMISNLEKLIWKYLIYKRKFRFTKNDTFKILKESFKKRNLDWNTFKEDIYYLIDCISNPKRKEQYKIVTRFYLFSLMRSHQHYPVLFKLLFYYKCCSISSTEFLKCLDVLLECFYLLSINDERFNKFEKKIDLLLKCNNFNDLFNSIKKLKKEYLNEFNDMRFTDLENKIKKFNKKDVIHSLFIYLYIKENEDKMEKATYENIIKYSSIEHILPVSKNKKEKKKIEKIRFLTILSNDSNSKASAKRLSEKIKDIKNSQLYIDFNKKYFLDLIEKYENKLEEIESNLDHEFWKKREEELAKEIAKLLLQDVILEKIEEIEKILKNYNKKSGKRKNENVLKNLEDCVNNKKYDKLKGFLDELKSNLGSNKELKEKIEELEKIFLDLIKN